MVKHVWDKIVESSEVVENSNFIRGSKYKSSCSRVFWLKLTGKYLLRSPIIANPQDLSLYTFCNRILPEVRLMDK